MSKRTIPLRRLGRRLAAALGGRFGPRRRTGPGFARVDRRLLRDIGLAPLDLPVIFGPGRGPRAGARIARPAALIQGIHNNFERAANDNRCCDAA